MFAAGFWSFWLIFEAASSSVNDKILWAKLGYLGAVSTPIFYFLFVLRFTGKDKFLSLKNALLLFIVPVITFLLTITNEQHHLIWSGFSALSTETNLMEYYHGIGFWLGYMAYNYLILLLSTAYLFRFIFQQRKAFSFQGWIVFIAGLFPWTASVIYLTGIDPVHGLDIVPVSIILSGILLAYSILYFRFLDLAPVAREILLETLSDGIIALDGQNRIQDINEAALIFLGIRNKNITGLTAESSGAMHTKLMDAVINPESIDQIEIQVDGKTKVYNITQKAIRNYPGSRLIILRDITERKLAEEAVLNERTLFRTIIDLIPDAVYVKDTEGRKVFANPREVHLSGMNSEVDIIGKTDFNLLPENEARRSQNEDDFVLSSGKPILDIDGTLIDKEGNLHWLLGSKVPLRDVHGKITGLVGVTHDITTRRLVEAKLRESEANFRTFFETMDDMIFIASKQGEIFYINNSFTRKLEYQLIDIRGLHLPDIHQAGKREEIEVIYGEILAGKRDSCTMPLVRKDGTFLPVETRVWFGKWDGNDCIFGLSKDLSKEQESLQKFNKIFDNNPALMAISSIPDRKFMEVNHAFLTKSGYTKEELIGKSAMELGLFVRPEIQNEIAADLEKTGTSYNREMKIKTKSGAILDGLFSGEIIKNQNSQYFLNVLIDVTEIKKMEEDIKLQNEFYSIASKVSERLIQTNSDRLDIEINHSLEMLGLFNKVDRTYIFDLNQVTDEISNTFEWCANGVRPQIDKLQNLPFAPISRWKDNFLNNEHIYIESVSDLPDELHFEKEILEPHGIKSLMAMPMFYGPALIGFIGFDSVSEIKQWNDQVILLLKVFANVLAGVIYKKKTEAALQKAKLEADIANKAKSEFLANMSHEIRTPLNGIIGFTDLLIKTPLNKTQQQYAENINISGQSLLGIINDILDFSKIEAGKMDLDTIKTDIIELVEQSSDIIKYHVSKKGLELLLNIQPDLPRFALVDPVRLKQIMVNLLGNAVKFTETGEIELKVTFTKKNDTIGLFCFSVRDTGIGISGELQKKLFRAFSQADTSTTRKYGGTGLGLTISNILAEKMGGRIEINSEPGNGSTFYFTIETEFEAGDKLYSTSEIDIKRVLVIDDNENNRLILEHTFTDWGIEFTGCDNGLSAIKLIQESEPFNMAIVDYHMPYINGIETIEIIRNKLKLSPEDLPIVLLHSSSDDMKIYDECKKLGVRFNLTKPVKSQELLHYLKNIHHQTEFQPANIRNTETVISTVNTFDQNTPVILIAEDVAINMLLITTLIKQLVPNAKILQAKNGKVALDYVVNEKPTLVFMDVQMPEMDGIETTIAIRRFQEGKSTPIPIIALTAGAIKGEEAKCREAGMNDFLTKPIVPGDLYKVLEKYLSIVQDQSLTNETTISDPQLHIDEELFYQRFGSNKELWKELIKSVQTEFPEYFQLLEKAIKKTNMKDVQTISHSIKGASLNMCFYKLAELAKEMEEKSESDAENLQDTLRRMSIEWELILWKLNKTIL